MLGRTARRARRGDLDAVERRATTVLRRAERAGDAPLALVALRTRAAARLLLGRPDLVVEDATRLIDEHELEPTDLVLLLQMRGGAYASLDDHARAEADLERALALVDPDDRATVAALADLEVTLHIAHRRLPEAWAAANQAVEARPDNPGSLACRARVASLLGRTAEAEQDLARAIALSTPEDVSPLHLERAVVRLRSLDVEGAAVAYADALAASPIPAQGPALLAVRGAVALARDDTADASAAADALMAALATRPAAPPQQLGGAHLLRGDVRARTGDVDGAHSDAELAIGASGGGSSDLIAADAHRLRAWVHVRRGELDAAEADLATAARLREGSYDPSGEAEAAAVAAELAAAREGRRTGG